MKVMDYLFHSKLHKHLHLPHLPHHHHHHHHQDEESHKHYRPHRRQSQWKSVGCIPSALEDGDGGSALFIDYHNLSGRSMGDPLACTDHADASKDDRSEDFFDLIAHFQAGRIEDQRCELRPPPRMVKSVSIPQLDIKPAIRTDKDTVNDVFAQGAPYPMVMEPVAGGYRCEGFVAGTPDMNWESRNMAAGGDLDSQSLGSESEGGSTLTLPGPVVISQDSHINMYQKYCVGREHIDYVGESEDLGQVIMSVGTHWDSSMEAETDGEGDEGSAAPDMLVIVRTKTASYIKTLPACDGDFSASGVAREVSDGELGPIRFQPVACPSASRHISAFDDRFVKGEFKFGVIYQKFGQVEEESLFGNQGGSPAFDNFLALLGDKVPLQGFKGFRGGLDTVKGQTGSHSVYSAYKGRELMFHVSTLLPYSEGDNQQLQRKRHIGNDIVTIVFQEDNTPFLPNSIASHFLHVYIIVQPLNPGSPDTKYKVSTACRDDVPVFEPALSSPSIFNGDESFREFLLTKLINAELAAHKASRFADKMERTRSHYMIELHQLLSKRNEESLAVSSSANHSLEKSVSSGMIDSFRKFANRKPSSSATGATAGSSVPSSMSMDAGSGAGKRQSAQAGGTPKAGKKTFWSRQPHHPEKTRSWERKTAVGRTASGGESSSLNGFRATRASQTSLSRQGDEVASSTASSPKDKRTRANGRSTPSSTYSEEEFFGNNAGDDSDTGVAPSFPSQGSMSPADTTPNSTLEMRLNPAQRATLPEPRGLYSEESSGADAQKKPTPTSYKKEYHTAKEEVAELERKFLKKEAENQKLREEMRKMREEIEKRQLNEKDYKNKVQSLLSSMSREEMV